MNKKLQRKIDNIPKIKYVREYKEITSLEGNIKDVISTLESWIKEFGERSEIVIYNDGDEHFVAIDCFYTRPTEEVERDKQYLIEEYNKSKQKAAKRKKELKERELQTYQKLKAKYGQD